MMYSISAKANDRRSHVYVCRGSITKPKAEVEVHTSGNGLSIFTTAVFIVGSMSGAGVLALPYAMSQGSWWTALFIVYNCVVGASSCTYLGKCWIIIEERWPTYKNRTRDPFPTIGEKALGPWMKTLCAVSMVLSLFGCAIVFLLLCAELCQNVLGVYFHREMCDWIIITAVILCPVSWLKSPESFSEIGFTAMGCTVASCFLILIKLIFHEHTSAETTVSQHSGNFIRDLLLGFSNVLFSYGGVCALPTFQADMTNKNDFPTAVNVGFGMFLCLYIPIAVGGFLVFGDHVDPNILVNLEKGTISTIIHVLMCIHLFCAFLIVLNPVSLDLEQRFDVPHRFTWKRCALRTMVILAVLFFALTIPDFGRILNLVGSTTVPLQTFILPPWFYLCLCQHGDPNFPEIPVSKKLKAYFCFVILVGIVIGVGTTFYAVHDIAGVTTLSKKRPCYATYNVTTT